MQQVNVQAQNTTQASTAFEAKHIPLDEKQQDKLDEITRLLVVLNTSSVIMAAAQQNLIKGSKNKNSATLNVLWIRPKPINLSIVMTVVVVHIKHKNIFLRFFSVCTFVLKQY